MSNFSVINSQDSIINALQTAILKAIPTAHVEVQSPSSGHFTISVTDKIFAGKNRVESQRLVYAAITPLMSGDHPPVHAIDSLRTLTP